MTAGSVMFAVATPEPGGNRYERSFAALGPTGRDVLAVLAGLLAFYFVILTFVPGPAARVAPEGIWVAGLAREGIAMATEFITADDVVRLELVEREYRGTKAAPTIVIHRRRGRPIKLACDSKAEGEWFIAATQHVLEPRSHR